MVPPSDPAAKTGGKTTMGGFARGRLSPDEAERLAATFRPCWALDESQSAEADTLVRTVRGTYAGLAPVAYATNGAHAPPAPTPSHEPENSIIIDRSGLDDTQPGVAVGAPAGQTAKGPSGTLILRPSNAPKPRPSGAPDARRHGGPNQPQVVPSVRPQSVSVSFEEGYPRPSRKGLWIGMGAVAVALVSIGIWAASNAGGGMDGPTPIPIKPVQDKTAATVLPPLPESIAKPQLAPPPQPTVAAPPPVLAVPPQAAPPPAAPQAETLPKATAPPSPPVPAAPAPAPPPAPIRVTAAPAPRPYYPPPVRTPPPQRPKAGSPTIVREVPF